MDLVSIIVPIYKVEEYLEECISSIVNQTYKNIEIILVDDGSPDRCGIICDEWAQKDSRIRVIHKENGGVSDARNAGIDSAVGTYIACVDPDDFVSDDYISTLLESIGQADLCCCNYITFSETEEKTFAVKDMVITEKQYWELLSDDDLSQYLIVPWNKLYRSEIWQNVRYPKGMVHEDRYVLPELLSKCNKIVCLSKPKYYYRYRPFSITTERLFKSECDDYLAFHHQLEYLIQCGFDEAIKLTVIDYEKRLNAQAERFLKQGKLSRDIILTLSEEEQWIDKFVMTNDISIIERNFQLLKCMNKHKNTFVLISLGYYFRNFFISKFIRIKKMLKK